MASNLRVLAAMALLFPIAGRVLASEEVDPRALLRRAVDRWNAAEVLSAKYVVIATTLPVEARPDPVVFGRFNYREAHLYIHRPCALALRGTLAVGDEFYFDGHGAWSVIPDNEGERRIREEVLGGIDLDAMTASTGLSTRTGLPLVWLIRSDGWRRYFSRADNLRLLGDVVSPRALGGGRCARIAFDGFDGMSWEMWIRADTAQIVSIRTREVKDTMFFAARPGSPAPPLNLDEADQRFAAMTSELTFLFQEVDFSQPAEPPAIPDGPRDRADVEPSPPSSEGESAPALLGKRADGSAVSSADFAGDVWAAMVLASSREAHVKSVQVRARVARDHLKDPSRVVLFLSTEPTPAVRQVLESRELQGCTVIVRDGAAAAERLFLSGNLLVVDANGVVKWCRGYGNESAVWLAEFEAALDREIDD